MAARNRRLITQTAGLALAAFAVASVSAPHNAAYAAASSGSSQLLASGVRDTTLQANGKLLQVTKTDGDDFDPLVHHHYP